jgi:putative dimethyl sulfoxide reductase chaperone
MTDKPLSHQIATLYRFCALSMQYPEPGWFTQDYRKSLYLLLEELEANEELEKLEKAFSQTGDILETLQIEHTRLFINGVPHVAAPPYGSVYIDKSLQGKLTEKTLQFYREKGFNLKDNSDLPDHICHQLEFLSLLAEQNDSPAEMEFLNKLFLPWFPHFKKRVEEEAQHPFYSVIVQLIDFFTMEENEHGI